MRRPKNIDKIRPRLNADELEEKVLNELKTALADANYFVDLEHTLKMQSDSKNKSCESEYQRAQKELNDVTNQFNGLLMNQGKMQLTDLALQMTSEELNRLAKKKMDLEKHIKGLDYQPQGTEVFREQSLFVENQIRNLMQGWQKATPATKKRLLRRTIKAITITRGEILITFWLNAEDSRGGFIEGSEIGSDGLENIVSLRRVSPQASDRNLSIISSGNVGNGRSVDINTNLLILHDKVSLNSTDQSRTN